MEKLDKQLLVVFAIEWGSYVATYDGQSTSANEIDTLRTLEIEELVDIFEKWVEDFKKSDITDVYKFFNMKIEELK